MYPNLEAELRRQNIKRTDLAEHLDCAVSTISDKMQGNSEFSLGACKKIKALLGNNMSIEYLFASDTEQTA